MPPFVLAEHADLDANERPSFMRELPTAESVARAQVAAAAAAKAKDPDAPASSIDSGELMIHLVAGSVYRVDNLGSGGTLLAYPEGHADRVEYVRRLPLAWIQELGGAVLASSDLDEEEEIDSPTTGSGDSAPTGGLQLQDMPAVGAA